MSTGQAPALLRVGLTGGIGSGKSTVASALARRGACIVDTDAIARQLTAPGGAALPFIAKEFGASMVGDDGALDRARMREQVFADASARRRLEGILHPLIGEQARLQAAAAAPTRPIVFDVPLLAESGHWRARVDRVLVVDCPVEVQVARVTQRSAWSDDEVRRVIGQQATREHRRSIADAIIYNGSSVSLAALESLVGRLWQHWWPQCKVPEGL